MEDRKTRPLSTSEPALQNIPIRTELGKELRKALQEQTPILNIDYADLEVRCMAKLMADFEREFGAT